MTYKELVLDSLINDLDWGECKREIKEYFIFNNIEISDDDLDYLLDEMEDEGSLTVYEKL